MQQDHASLEPSRQISRLINQLDKIVNNVTKVQVTLAELTLRHEHTARDLMDTEKQYKEEIRNLREEIQRLQTRITSLESYLWKAVGGVAMIAFVAPFLFKFLVKLGDIKWFLVLLVLLLV